MTQYVASQYLSRNVKRVLCFSRFWSKSRIKETTRKPRRRWENNIKTDLRVIGWDGMDWIHLAQCRDQWRALVSTVMNLRVS
jgi:hypothetical protein